MAEKPSKPDSQLVPILKPTHAGEVRSASGLSMPGVMGMTGSVSYFGQCSCAWAGPVRLDAHSAGRDLESHLTDPAL